MLRRPCLPAAVAGAGRGTGIRTSGIGGGSRRATSSRIRALGFGATTQGLPPDQGPITKLRFPRASRRGGLFSGSVTFFPVPGVEGRSDPSDASTGTRGGPEGRRRLSRWARPTIRRSPAGLCRQPHSRSPPRQAVVNGPQEAGRRSGTPGSRPVPESAPRPFPRAWRVHPGLRLGGRFGPLPVVRSGSGSTAGRRRFRDRRPWATFLSRGAGDGRRTNGWWGCRVRADAAGVATDQPWRVRVPRSRGGGFDKVQRATSVACRVEPRKAVIRRSEQAGTRRSASSPRGGAGSCTSTTSSGAGVSPGWMTGAASSGRAEVRWSCGMSWGRRASRGRAAWAPGRTPPPGRSTSIRVPSPRRLAKAYGEGNRARGCLRNAQPLRPRRRHRSRRTERSALGTTEELFLPAIQAWTAARIRRATDVNLPASSSRVEQGSGSSSQDVDPAEPS